MTKVPRPLIATIALFAAMSVWDRHTLAQDQADGVQACGVRLPVTAALMFDACNKEEDIFSPVCDPFTHCSVAVDTCFLSVRTGAFQYRQLSFCGGCGAPVSSASSVLPVSSTPVISAQALEPGVSEMVLSTDTVDLASVSVDGTAANGGSLSPVLSGDGQFLAFDSAASNLVSGDTNQRRDVFVRNRFTGQTARVSVSTAGVQGNADSIAPLITPDGRYVAFLSQATTLAGGASGFGDVFVHDRQTGTTERVNVGPADQPAPLATWPDAFPGVSLYVGVIAKSDQIAISDDGRYVAFVDATSQPTTGHAQSRIYLRDRHLATTTIISPQQPFASRIVSSSAAGPSVFTTATPHGMVTGDRVSLQRHTATYRLPDGTEWSFPLNTNGSCGYFFDPKILRHPTITVLSPTTFTVPLTVTVAGSGGTATRVEDLRTTARPRLAMSGDGRSVAFDWLYQIVVEDTSTTPGGNGGRCPGTTDHRDVYVYDRVSSSTSLVSVGATGGSGNGYSGWPSISSDGRYVAFASEASNLVAGDQDNSRNIFVRDRLAGTTVRIANARSVAPAISRDGRTVVFASIFFTGNPARIYAYNMQTQQMGRVSVPSPTQFPNGPSFGAALSGDSLTIAFASAATDLAPGDANGADDVFAGSHLAPVILAQPVDNAPAVIGGSGVTFSAPVRSITDPAYKWQASSDGGGTWADASVVFPAAIPSAIPHGDSAATLVVFARAGMNGVKFRAVITNTAGSVTSNSVTFTVANTTPPPSGQPTMSLDRTSLQFGATNSGTAFVSATGSQTVRVIQTGSGAVSWAATADRPWLSVSLQTGVRGALLINVGFSNTVPITGTVTGTILVAFSGATTSAARITVTLTSVSEGASVAPFGVFDTPPNGVTGVTGSVPVTGWALDDLGVTRVRIFRDPVIGEVGEPIFIGNAVMVDGARPDVAAAFPSFPRHTRAGWGYLLLTNFLPNRGNGTFRLHAYAEDVDGHSSLLGTKTVTTDNANATRPFGAIDTPGQGETIGGTSYNNFGWVLVRAPRHADPPNGGTVTVFIDSVPVGSPSGWTSRPDLTALFAASEYPGAMTAAGVYSFNPQVYGDGIHTIAWGVTDNAGNTDGIGSRFFTVAGSATTSASTSELHQTVVSAAVSQAHQEADSPPTNVEAALGDGSTPPGLLARRGFDVTAPFRPVAVEGEVAVIQGEELDRLEVRLEPGEGALSGYLRVGDALQPLPVGSHLDVRAGTYGWMPGVGFTGTYALVFVRSTNGEVITRQDVRITLHPKGSNRVGPQVVIDAPLAGAELRPHTPFFIGGWGIDLDDVAGTGVDSLHVWAYPVSGEAPIFLGHAEYGGARPDVAAIFGRRFTASGYGLIAAGLDAGIYDVAVFAWSTTTAAFAPAETVRITVR